MRIGASITDFLDKLPGLPEAFKLIDEQMAMTVFTHSGEYQTGPNIMPTTGEAFAGSNVHRALLVRCLNEYARHLGIDVRLKTRVARYFDDTEGRGCVTQTGERFTADVVIAADGIGSASSALVDENAKQAVVSSGMAVYRGTFPAKLAKEKPNLNKRFFPEEPRDMGNCMRFSSDYQRAMIFATAEIVNFYILHKDSGNVSERWDAREDKGAVLNFLKENGWAQDVYDLIDVAPDDQVYNWRLMFREPSPNWISSNGHVIQLGDAAHPFLPSAANGATQAMEDAVCLASCLRLAGKAQIPLALRVHRRLR